MNQHRSAANQVSLCGVLGSELVLTSHLLMRCGPNGSCLFAAFLPTDTVGSQNFQSFSTRQTPRLGD